MMAPPIYWNKMICSTIALVHYNGNWNVSITLPIQQAIAFSISCRKRKRKILYKMEANLRDKRASIKTVQSLLLYIICHLRDHLHFSLVPTLRYLFKLRGKINLFFLLLQSSSQRRFSTILVIFQKMFHFSSCITNQIHSLKWGSPKLWEDYFTNFNSVC